MTTQRIADSLRELVRIGDRNTDAWNEARAALAAADLEKVEHQSHFVNLYRPQDNAAWSKGLRAESLETSRRRRLPVCPGLCVEIVTNAANEVMLARVAETFDAKRPNDV